MKSFSLFSSIILVPIILYLWSERSRSRGSAWDYSFSVGGVDVSLADFSGQPVLVVNTASECGFAYQSADLQSLYSEYEAQGLVIIRVPSNSFNQEPLSRDEIVESCGTEEDGIRESKGFVVTDKVDLHVHPFFKFAGNSTFGLGYWAMPKWNYWKILIGKDGKLVDFFLSTTSPLSPAIRNAIDTEIGRCPCSVN